MKPLYHLFEPIYTDASFKSIASESNPQSLAHPLTLFSITAPQWSQVQRVSEVATQH
jgi:hypothetical protein